MSVRAHDNEVCVALFGGSQDFGCNGPSSEFLLPSDRRGLRQKRLRKGCRIADVEQRPHGVPATERLREILAAYTDCCGCGVESTGMRKLRRLTLPSVGDTKPAALLGTNKVSCPDSRDLTRLRKIGRVKDTPGNYRSLCL